MLTTQLAYRAKNHAAAQAIALTYVGMGDKEKAFAWVETAYRERDNMAMIKAFPF
jgi:hypothetical protein